jgi:hypothetical protein
MRHSFMMRYSICRSPLPMSVDPPLVHSRLNDSSCTSGKYSRRGNSRIVNWVIANGRISLIRQTVTRISAYGVFEFQFYERSFSQVIHISYPQLSCFARTHSAWARRSGSRLRLPALGGWWSVDRCPVVGTRYWLSVLGTRYSVIVIPTLSAARRRDLGLG